MLKDLWHGDAALLQYRENTTSSQVIEYMMLPHLIQAFEASSSDLFNQPTKQS